ncbi:polyphosphate kinase 1 [Geobacter pickeringii]|uniref:Polyphosphate kinase n=1 Tax=Geobacter pickeringii TaxID=345632 RepID=A0A0B5BDC4_9BACT|nr:polyphosphate kinase 1 [Geobacter pickeringii]AJE02086.1 polyphosphate kinase [Geobacter pickeringii]
MVHKGRLPKSDILDPIATGEAEIDLAAPELYLNRELTWLEFNQRVLHEAEDPRTPLLERTKFVAIVGSNLDEFFMKRIGGLKQQVGAGVQNPTVDGRPPLQQIAECYAVVRELVERKRRAFGELLTLLKGAGIEILGYSELSETERTVLRQHYYRNIYPLLTPQSIDPAHPFPFISNLSLNLLVTLRYSGDRETSLARVKVPVGAGIPRFLRVGNGERFVPLEEVMRHNLEMLFPEMEVMACELFRVTRNANTERSEEQADDLLSLIESELQDRRFAPIVRLEVGDGMDPVHRGMLAAELELDESSDVFEVEGMLALRDLLEVAGLPYPLLRDPPHHPVDNPRFQTRRNIFHIIRDAGSILLQHPYESFSTSVERFLQEASEDPKVRAIKMTLYRTAPDSRLIDFLVEAANNGKQVAVAVELKARFDEAANIRLAERMEEAGVHVTYGVVGLKTHCKVILVVRQDYNGLRRYVHIGTGNYHPGTARIYSDLGLLTSDDVIGQDATELFNYLTTGYTPKRNYRKLLPAPKHLKKELLAKIEREALLHTADMPGQIQFKMNALEDADIVAALYRAARRGVRIDLIVRDSCRLRPGLPGLSETVRVVSIVGRFLEHSRIYYFRNGGDEEYFLGSADAMKRNLEYRVEVLAPVEAPELRKELRSILDTNLNDRRCAWEMNPDGTCRQLQPAGAEDPRGSHEILIAMAEKRARQGARLKKKKAVGVVRRNLK